MEEVFQVGPKGKVLNFSSIYVFIFVCVCFFFLMRTIFKVFIECVTVFLLFYIVCFLALSPVGS